MPDHRKVFNEFAERYIEPTAKGERVIHGMVSPIASPGDWPVLQKYLAGRDVSKEIPEDADIVKRAMRVTANKGIMQNLIGLPQRLPAADVLQGFCTTLLEPMTAAGCETKFFVVTDSLLSDVGALGSKYSSDYLDGITNVRPRGNFHSVPAAGMVAMYGYSGPTMDEFDGFDIRSTADDPALAKYLRFWQEEVYDSDRSFF